jgi:hypothetical protein
MTNMSRWNVKASTLFILGSLTLVMLLIVVLPDVDLPDTAFHRGTAPVLVHAQANAAPAAVVVASLFQSTRADRTLRRLHEPGGLSADPDPNFIPILLRSIRC